MNVCCNGKFSNRKLQENERKCQRRCDIVVRGFHHQDRPYNDDSTASRLLSEVKHHLARLVLRWGTTLESLVLIFCFSTSSFSIKSSPLCRRPYYCQLYCRSYQQVLLIHITQADTLLDVENRVSSTEWCLAWFVLVQKYQSMHAYYCISFLKNRRASIENRSCLAWQKEKVTPTRRIELRSPTVFTGVLPLY